MADSLLGEPRIKIFIALVHIALLSWFPHAEAYTQDTVAELWSAKRSVELVQLGSGIPWNSATRGGLNASAAISPDQSKIVAVLRQGDVERNVVTYKLILWRWSSDKSWVGPTTIAAMESSSNRPAIESVTWCTDPNRILFLGETVESRHQLYSIDTSSGQVTVLTNEAAHLLAFSATESCDAVAYLSESGVSPYFGEYEKRHGLVLKKQFVPSLLTDQKRLGDSKFGIGDSILSVKKFGTQPTNARKILQIPAGSGRPVISPNGNFVVIEMAQSGGSYASWREYEDPYLRSLLGSDVDSGVESPLPSLHLVNVENGAHRVLLNAPFVGAGFAWTPDSRAIFVESTFMPLTGVNGAERMKRRITKFSAEIGVADGAIVKVKDGPPLPMQWLEIEEDMHTPPKLKLRTNAGVRDYLLLDLANQFAGVTLANVEDIQWRNADGRVARGGLFLPVDYQPGRRYPVVIQTHGWNPNSFAVDGYIATSGYAAQALAAKGLVVLQVEDGGNSSNPVINTSTAAEQALGTYEGAIAALDTRGLIDIGHIGILGFSATCSYVKHALTRSRYKFAAAVVAEGNDDGYFQYILFLNQSPLASIYEGRNGGTPFGSGRHLWIERSPSFHMEDVITPTRILALNRSGILFDWEWLSALSRLRRPVEMIAIQDGAHNLVRPWDRMIAVDGNVDWFVFWLQGEVDPSPEKAEQYRRWDLLRRQQEQAPDQPLRSYSPGSRSVEHAFQQGVQALN